MRVCVQGKLKQMKLDKGGGVSEAVDTSSSKKTAADETGAEKEREQLVNCVDTL